MAYINAFGGMVWWKAVSNTPTCGRLGISSLTARTPFKLAGLCRGARSEHSSKDFSTSLVRMTDLLNFSPPCTIRCPTASISSSDLMTPISGSVSREKINFTPAVCSGMSCMICFFSPLASFTFTKAPSKPTRSAPPDVITLLSSMLYSAYLIEDEPQFKTNIFIENKFKLMFVF